MSTLSGKVKVGYGSGELGIAAAEFFVRVYLLKLYVDVVGLDARLAGTVLAVAVVWDAVTDPLMGEISDRTRSRFGRRRPWIVIGSLLAAGSIVVLFTPPEWDTQMGIALYLLAAYIVFNTALTVMAVPHSALGGELTNDPDARNEVFGWRFLFANLGLVLAIVLPALGSGSAEAAAGVRWIAVALGISGALTALATRGRDLPGLENTRLSLRSYWRSLRAVARSSAFRPLVLASLVGSIGLTINSSMALFYYEHRLQLAEREVFLWILLPFALVIALSIGGWVLLARTLGRRRTAFAGVFLLGIGTSVVYPLFAPGSLSGPVLWGLVGGLLVGSVFLFDATVADVVDLDEALHGVHREGIYFGVWRMASKIARAIGLAVTGWVLDAVGFAAGSAEQTEAVGRGIAWAFGPGVGVFFIFGALVWLCVPIDGPMQRRVQAILDRRRSRKVIEGAQVRST